jgi:hypothetical protein
MVEVENTENNEAAKNKTIRGNLDINYGLEGCPYQRFGAERWWKTPVLR